eukprot:TRINITY_DN4073_c0_g3_i3.p1 TRINITY_DN4073_c0_g3~~TRINITY_DN4073_c0_g3_i3.p1  ORF type:complete len:663 (-),score=117.47 TRINITY_DN4073_c0_g3_i3:30-1850(-)
MAGRAGRRHVCYYYDNEIGNFFYGRLHPMKPHRIRMTHNLLINYGLYNQMEVCRAPKASESDMSKFHSDDYINFLKLITPDDMHEYTKQLQRFNVGEDCPVFDGMFQYCQISAGGSIDGAVKLNTKKCDVAVNWAGGLHHAKKSEASGFCYVNDIVLAILELLKHHQRVLYIDIDIHHGDGVEEAFYTTDRVMTVSFHKFGEYFPGTGHLNDIGAEKGKYYSVNFPLHDGIDDQSYLYIFKPLIRKVMEMYQPSVVVFQSGCDSLAGDRLGCFNLSLQGHAQCLEFVQSFGLPVLLLGGGGYTIRNVARCWAFETAQVIGAQLDDMLPHNDYYEYYGPDYRISIPPSNMENMNTREELDRSLAIIMENLRQLPPVPSVQMNDVPPDIYGHDDFDPDDQRDPDTRISQADADQRISRADEMSDSDDDGDGRRDHRSYRTTRIDLSTGGDPRTGSTPISGITTPFGLVTPFGNSVVPLATTSPTLPPGAFAAVETGASTPAPVLEGVVATGGQTQELPLSAAAAAPTQQPFIRKIAVRGRKPRPLQPHQPHTQTSPETAADVAPGSAHNATEAAVSAPEAEATTAPEQPPGAEPMQDIPEVRPQPERL